VTPPAERPWLAALLPLLLLPSAAALDELAAAEVALAALWPALASVGVADVSVTMTVTMPGA